LAGSIYLTQASPVLCAPGQVNSVNNGYTIQGGTYYNTQGSRTTFQSSNGLYLKAGDTVRGLESNIAGTPDGHGGTIYLRAPGSFVLLNGNVDVSAVKNGTFYLGNGGKLFVDTSYLVQNGNVFANGVKGGLAQFNVTTASLGSNAK